MFSKFKVLTLLGVVAGIFTPSVLAADPTIAIDANALGFGIPSFGDILTFLIRGFFIIAGLLALLYLLLGAMSWVTSGGNKENVDKARDKITAAIVGLIIIVAVLAIIVTLEQVVFKGAICFGLSCPITIPGLLERCGGTTGTACPTIGPVGP